MTAKSPTEATANADQFTSYEQGMCLQYVRGPCWEVGSFFGSAIDAWNGAARKHPGDRNPPLGAPCFYSGGKYGHIVISKGSDRMRSTDCTTSTRVSDEDLDWPVHAWGDTYLGWTEDLNGVDLPGLTPTPPPEEDPMPDYDHGACNKAQKITAGAWATIAWQGASGAGHFNEGSKVVTLGGRTYTATVHASFDAPKGATLRLRFVEVADGDDQETGPQTEVIATSGSTAGSHTANGYVSKGRNWAVRVSADQDCTLTSADCVILSWTE